MLLAFMEIAGETGITQVETRDKQLVHLVGGRHQLINSDKIILTIALATVVTVFVIGAEKAYGQFEEVPFDYQNSGCTLVENTIDYKRYECFADWRSEDYKEPGEEYTPAEDGCMAGWDIDIRTGECKPHEIIEEEAIAECEADPTCPRGFYIEPEEPTKWEKIAEGLNPDSPSATDQELIKKINQMLGARCYQGVGTTAGSQEERSFDIPTIKIMVDGVERTVLDTQSSGKSLNLKGILGLIERAVRECVAQEILLDEHGGVMSVADTHFAYCDKILPSTDVEFDPFCGKNYSDHSVVAQNVPVWSQQRVNEEANRDIDTPVFSILENICKGYYERSYKTIFPECVEYFKEIGTGGTYAKQQEMKVYDDSAYQTFKDGDESEQLEKLMKEKLAEDIQGLLALQRALQK